MDATLIATASDWSEWLVMTTLLVVRLLPTSALIPATWRFGLSRLGWIAVSMVVAAGLAGKLESSPNRPPWPTIESWDWAVLLLRELVTGLAIALGFAVLLAGVSVAGGLLSQLTGLGLADVSEPQPSAVGDTVWERFFGILAIALFWVTNSHRLVVEALCESLRRFPLGQPWPEIDAAPRLAELLTSGLELGLRIAAPMTVCVLTVNCVAALLGRQRGPFAAWGMTVAVNLLVLVLTISIALPQTAVVYGQQLASGIQALMAGIK